MAIHGGTVIRAYQAAHPRGLRLEVGDELVVRRRDVDFSGWIWCADEAAGGAEGWVPEARVDRSGQRAVVRAAYDGAELTVRAGERLTVLDDESGWLWCRNEGGEHGWVPQSHVAVDRKRLTEEFTKSSVDLDEILREHKQVEEALRESEAKYRALVDNSLQGLLIAAEAPPRLLFVNPALERFLARDADDLLAMSPRELSELFHPADAERVLEDYRALLSGLAAPQHTTFRVRRPDGELRWIEAFVSPIRVDGAPAVQAAMVDITRRKRVEDERERLIEKLNRALDEIGALRGIIPICASCKKVRKDDGYWTQVETYVAQHSSAEFSHGLCPDCLAELYPDASANASVNGGGNDSTSSDANVSANGGADGDATSGEVAEEVVSPDGAAAGPGEADAEPEAVSSDSAARSRSERDE
jgi:PAS domain S-box-containing protein